MKVKENVSSVSRPGDRKALAVDVTVWASSSWLIQVTVVPAFTVSAGVLNPWPRISTCVLSIWAGAATGAASSSAIIVSSIFMIGSSSPLPTCGRADRSVERTGAPRVTEDERGGWMAEAREGSL